MATDVIVVEHQEDWKPEYDGSTVITASDYISQKKYFNKKPIRIINFCRDFKYLSVGYYCSLLAEARGHKVIPSVKTMLELDNRSLYRHGIAELEALAHRELLDYPTTEEVELRVYFGQPDNYQLKKLATKIFEQFRFPLLQIKLHHHGRWKIKSIRSQSINSLNNEARALFISALNRYTKQRWMAPKIKSVARYDLAILYNPSEELPPSDQKALEKFIRIGKTMDIDVELIQKKDFGRLYEFDALFIRETTGIDHHTFRFAKKADREGMVVIDDPESILRCTNKVYLAELLKTHKIKTPKTVIFDYTDLLIPEQTIPYPIVLKIPDGSFSRGVHKVENREQLQKISALLLEESDIILAQEYVYTEFDWRIGILNRQAIFACRYHMSKKHWQVYKHSRNGKIKEGGSDGVSIHDVPQFVLTEALNAANLIGNGFYGVDLKQRGNEVFVIEINDNPNVDSGVEDELLKDDIYRIILGEFIRRLNDKWAG
jgi:glutathione synthase/RimK-type ligase-like ATP-grasp enzyme